MVTRRKFLYQVGILTIASSFKINPFNYFQVNSIKESKNEFLKILNDKRNFLGYSDPKFCPGRESLKKEGLEKVLKSSMNILSKDQNDYIFLEEKSVIDINIDLFNKIVSPYPSFIIPLASRVLEKEKKIEENEVIELFSTIKKDGKRRGFWYGEAYDKDEDANKFSIIYSDNEKILIYGKGQRYNVEGEILSLIEYKQKGKNKVETNTSCFLDIGVPFYFFFASGIVKKRASRILLEKILELQKKTKTLIEILDKKNLEWIKKKYGKKEFIYMKKLSNEFRKNKF